MRRLLTILAISASIGWANPGFAQSTCSTAIDKPSAPPSLAPSVDRNGETVTLGFDGIKNRLLQNENAAALAKAGRLTFSIYVNGKVIQSGLPWTSSSATLREPRNRQMDYYVHVMNGEKIFDISEFQLKEGGAQNVEPESFNGSFAGEGFALGHGKTLRAMGLSDKLAKVAVKLGFLKVVWVLNATAKSEIKEFIEKAQDGVSIVAKYGKTGKVVSITVVDKASRQVLEADPSDFTV
ncbi:MAG TPA: hypothetical protein VM432_08210 [Bdellovibrionales bacterium]|nr:hypothetical protein [Bdellovibrionales bacterium]